MTLRVSFPSVMQEFQVGVAVPKNTQIRYAHIVGTAWELISTSPIDLRPNDHVWIDMRNGRIEIVERGGFTIWRASWVN